MKAIVNNEVKNGKVTNVKKFRAKGGYGLDVDVMAVTELNTLYFQVVLYDEQALHAYPAVNVDDIVDVTGHLKVKPYQKADGTAAVSLTIERPELFDKHTNGGRRESLLPNQPAVPATAVTATTVPAEETTSDEFEDEFWEPVDQKREYENKTSPEPFDFDDIDELPFDDDLPY